MPPDQTAPDDGPRRRRKLSAIMMVDVQGYSQLMGTDEDTTVDLIQDFHQRIGTLIEQFEGRVVDTAGDSVFCEFDSVVNAVRCARRVQEDQAALNRERGGDGHMHTRIGLHLGDVIVEDYHVYGDGVNIAARLEPLAEPGGICMSEAVYQQIRNKLDMPLEDLGLRELKNIQYPIHLYRVPPPQLVDGDAPPADQPTGGAPPAPLPPPAAPPPAAPTPPALPSAPADADTPTVGDVARTLGKEAAKAFKHEAKAAARALKDEAKRVARESRHAQRQGRDAATRESSSAGKPESIGSAAGRLGQEVGQAAGRLGQDIGKAASEFGQRVGHDVPKQVDAAVRGASAAAEEALRSALGDRKRPPTDPPTPPPPSDLQPVNSEVERGAWTRELQRTGTLIPLVIGVFLLISPVIMFPTGGVFSTGGAILIAVCLGGVWARRSGRPGNFMVALGLGLASGAIWTNWSGVTNSLFMLTGLIVALTGAGSRGYRHRHERRRARRAKRDAKRRERHGRRGRRHDKDDD